MFRRWYFFPVCLIGICGTAVFMGAVPTRVFGHDTFFLLENGWRALNGQRPHIDYASPWGPVTFLIVGLGLTLSHYTANGIGYGNALFGLLIASTGWSVYFGLWAYLMPFMLFGALLAILLWDVVRRDDISKTSSILWIAIALLVPFLGVLAYFFVGKSSIPAWQRFAIIGGGLGAYLVLFAVGAVVGGIV